MVAERQAAADRAARLKAAADQASEELAAAQRAAAEKEAVEKAVAARAAVEKRAAEQAAAQLAAEREAAAHAALQAATQAATQAAAAFAAPATPRAAAPVTCAPAQQRPAQRAHVPQRGLSIDPALLAAASAAAEVVTRHSGIAQHLARLSRAEVEELLVEAVDSLRSRRWPEQPALADHLEARVRTLVAQGFHRQAEHPPPPPVGWASPRAQVPAGQQQEPLPVSLPPQPPPPPPPPPQQHQQRARMLSPSKVRGPAIKVKNSAGTTSGQAGSGECGISSC